MPLNHCPICDENDEKPSFKGNQVRGSDCYCSHENDDSVDVKWHWNRTIGKNDEQEPHSR